MRYLDELRHLKQQATRAEAAFKPRQLELLALILRCDVLHKHGSKFLSGGSWLSRLLRQLATWACSCCIRPSSLPPCTSCPADVSYQAFTALQSMLRRFPYASIGRHESGPWAGRPYVIVDERVAWQPLEAMA